MVAASGCSSNSSGSGTSASPSANAVSLTPEVQAKLQKVIDDVRVQFKAPGLQAGVWTDNGQWVGTSGVAKVGTSQAITPADHSRVGSITKTMTGTVILQLIDEGKLSFDDVIDKYVPGMPNGSTATIKNLIEMQSGIPTYTANTSVVNKYSAAPTTAFTPQELVNSVKKSPPMFAPGAQFFYSNTNFVLLGMVIEKVTGKSVSDNFKDRLFKPLGMNATSAPGTSTSLPEPFLSGITEQGDPLGKIKNATNWNPSFAFTAARSSPRSTICTSGASRWAQARAFSRTRPRRCGWNPSRRRCLPIPPSGRTEWASSTPRGGLATRVRFRATTRCSTTSQTFARRSS